MATTCDINGKKPEISYPCFWEYKLIITSNENLKDIVKEILKDKDYKISKSKKSKNNAYESYNLSVFILSENERLKLFEAFKTQKQIKFVL